MRIAYLGTGSWGFCLATLLAKKGYSVTSWTTDSSLAKELETKERHPRFPDITKPKTLRCTTSMQEALEGADLIVESVTAAGLRPVFQKLLEFGYSGTPLIITSKGIEQTTDLILPDVAIDVLGENARPMIGALSGPGYAQEVIHGLPTSVVAASYESNILGFIQETFSTPTFRVYPNKDLIGVSLGGALKNIIAIACGISHGLRLGFSARSALITRGLHEIRKLAIAMGARPDTLNGLAGMGDITLTCSTPLSRNFLFGELLAKGRNIEEAKSEVGMVVEGAYSCVSALELSQKHSVNMPIAENIHRILYEGLQPADAVALLMQRTVKEEHL